MVACVCARAPRHAPGDAVGLKQGHKARRMVDRSGGVVRSGGRGLDENAAGDVGVDLFGK